MITILRGLPGAGKSTWQETHYPKALVISADKHYMEGDEYKFTLEKRGPAHAACLRQYVSALTCAKLAGEDIVVDNVNAATDEIAPYCRLAEAYGREFKIVWLQVSMDVSVNRNVHSVPPAVIRQMAGKFGPIPLSWPMEIIVQCAHGTL